MYKILGADQKEYGPVGAEEVRQWIAQGRANSQTLALIEGSAEWRPLNAFLEFAGALAAIPTPQAPVPSPALGRVLANKTNGMAIAGFVLGLFSLLFCFIGPLFSMTGLIFSCIGLVQVNKQAGQNGKGLAIAGIILAIFGLLLFAFIVLSLIIGSQMQDAS